jgi:catechol-2,3-dioxygenase
MKSPWIAALRSVALTVPDLAQAERFYTAVWHLQVVAREAGALYFAGSGADHHLLALHEKAGLPTIRQVTLRARSAEALNAVAQAAGSAVERARRRPRWRPQPAAARPAWPPL